MMVMTDDVVLPDMVSDWLVARERHATGWRAPSAAASPQPCVWRGCAHDGAGSWSNCAPSGAAAPDCAGLRSECASIAPDCARSASCQEEDGQRHFTPRARVSEPEFLPPVKPPKPSYYGKAHKRVVDEFKEQRNHKELARKRAMEDRARVSHYCKLVSELAPPAPPPPRAITKLQPIGGDPARASRQKKDDSAAGATAAHAPRARLPPPPLGAAAAAGGSRRSADVAAHEQRLAALNRELGSREKELRAKMKDQPAAAEAADALPSQEDVEAMLRVRGDLSACYIGAIRSKVELLESIYAEAQGGA